jgi:hypothetical protein
MLRTLYRRLPLPKSFRPWLKSKVPLSLQRQRQFRQFGTINELYFWRLDHGIDTVVPIQNYFSNLFPDLETTSRGQIWIYDRNGLEIARREFELPHHGMHLVRISELVGRDKTYGTFMWHIRMPDSVANQELVRKNLVYFTDRGYICYEKDNSQPAFVHGVDRFAVFQRQDMESKDLFYGEPERARAWIPEFPIQADMQCSIDVMLLNRTQGARECSLTLHRNGGEKIFESAHNILPRGGALLSLDKPALDLLEGDTGYFMVTGLPTQWGRPAITRHFSSGAISVMHC